MIRVGLLGCGFMGEVHATAYSKMDDALLTGVYSHSAGKLQAFAEKFNTRAYEDPMKLIADVDVVDICLPTHLHEHYAILAADAGKHILCEKPISLTKEAFLRIQHAVNRNQVIFMAAHVLRFWPEYRKIKQLADHQDLGEIFQLSMTRLAQAPVWSSWFQDGEKSGGALFDLHVHDIDMARYILGPIKSVYTVGTQRGNAWDHVATTLVAASGAKVVCEASYMMAEGYPFTMSCRAVGTKGAAEFIMKAGVNLENREEAQNELMIYEGTPQRWSSDGVDAYEQELRYFLSIVSDGEPPALVRNDEVLEVLEIILAAERSLKSGEVVHL